jgi:hypothetical protein
MESYSKEFRAKVLSARDAGESTHEVGGGLMPIPAPFSKRPIDTSTWARPSGTLTGKLQTGLASLCKGDLI